MSHQSSLVARDQRALITRRLPVFAIGWLGAVGIWTVVFATEGRLTAVAAALAGIAGLALAGAVRLCRADPEAPRVLPIVVTTCVLLGIMAIGFVDAVGAYGEILAFMLLTLYLAAALLFSWGWQAELVLLVATLVPWALVLHRFTLFVPLLELMTAVTIGGSLALAIAEGAARNFRNVMRRRRAQQEATHALQVSRDAYRDLAESARDMIWAADLDGRLTYVNEALERFLDQPAADLLGRSMGEFYTPHPDNHRFEDVMARAQSGEILPLLSIECITPRGPRWIEVMSSPVLDAHGTVVGFRGINRDVQERRDAEARLRESEERFRSAFEDAAIGMGVTRLDGRTIRVNRALCDMLGYTEQELLGSAPKEIVHPDDQAQQLIDQGRLLAGEMQSYRAERRYLHKDGHVLWVHATVSMVHDGNGAPLYMIGQIQDVTERRLAEEALRGSLGELRRSEEKLRLLARRQVAIREQERKRLGFDLHDDVCQELVGVGILVESLRRKLAPMPAEQSGEFHRVVRYLNEVVEHLRLLARELRPLLLHDLGLDGGLGSLAEGMSSPTLRVVMERYGVVPRLHEETEVTVYRIAQEALANAARHASATRIVVSLGVSDGMLHLAIRDDGRGFDPAARPAAALGLASMEERALALGGRLHVTSAPGAGTTVTLTCPLTVRPAALATGSGGRLEPKAPRTKRAAER